MADYGLFNMSLGQDFRIVETQYVMLSFDTTMALLGGYATIIWQILGLLVGWHQDFSYNNALGLQLFTREKRGQGSKEADATSTSKAEAAVLNREPHDWCVIRAGAGALMPYLCCCLNKTRWYQERKKLIDQNQAIQEGLS